MRKPKSMHAPCVNMSILKSFSPNDQHACQLKVAHLEVFMSTYTIVKVIGRDFFCFDKHSKVSNSSALFEIPRFAWVGYDTI